jgi:hypothetical protein
MIAVNCILIMVELGWWFNPIFLEMVSQIRCECCVVGAMVFFASSKLMRKNN